MHLHADQNTGGSVGNNTPSPGRDGFVETVSGLLVIIFPRQLTWLLPGYFFQKEERRSNYELFEERNKNPADDHPVVRERPITILSPGCFGILAVRLDKLRTRGQAVKSELVVKR